MNSNEEIPKIIHYCWFGKKEKPSLIKKCIKSWKEILVDYEIIEWNEENFDLSINDFVKEAYQSRKFAFVSDFVRIHSLYHYGGIYLDTDVEVYKPFDHLLQHDSFWGFEQANYIATSTIGAKKNHPFIKLFLDSYKNQNFIHSDGRFHEVTNVSIATEMLENRGLVKNGFYQEIKNIGVIYPQDYFSPYDYINCQTQKTNNTHAIHYYFKSWLPLSTRIKSQFKKVLVRIIGVKNMVRLRTYFRV